MRCRTILLCMLFSAALFPIQHQKPMLGYYIPLSRDILPSFERRLSELKSNGYNAVILPLNKWDSSFSGPAPTYALACGAGIENGLTPKEIAAAVALVRANGLEPIFEIKAVGKAVATLGLLSKKHPSIVFNGKHSAVWNPRFTFPDGTTFENGVLEPIIRELVSTYGDRPPLFLNIGCDEFDKGALQTAAKAEAMTAGQFLAREINRVTSMVLRYNVTPIMYQDMFLAEELTNAGVVRGFAGDERFAHYEPMNGSRKAFDGGNVMDAVDLITDRSRIIIADWHYFDGAGKGYADYPSVDYFKTLGFKDVWPVTWYDMHTVRTFAAYATERGCNSMLASVWYLDLKDEYTDVARLIRNNSILYFKDPGLPEMKTPGIIIRGASGPVARARAGETVSLVTRGDIPSAVRSASFAIRVNTRKAWGETLSAAVRDGSIESKWTVAGSPGDIVDVKVDIISDDGLMHYGHQEAALEIVR